MFFDFQLSSFADSDKYSVHIHSPKSALHILVILQFNLQYFDDDATACGRRPSIFQFY